MHQTPRRLLRNPRTEWPRGGGRSLRERASSAQEDSPVPYPRCAELQRLHSNLNLNRQPAFSVAYLHQALPRLIVMTDPNPEHTNEAPQDASDGAGLQIAVTETFVEEAGGVFLFGVGLWAVGGPQS